ncbi:MAG: DNA repair protein RecN [Deltaproteobacteria bacterium]|nr:DNA repair protein RecN [Deltaproteobacteria bacterium]
MLLQLIISDFAIIKHLDLSLRKGLNILSGETGAGKSIIINAINLILGGRSSADLIRTGCEEAVVEGLFVLPDAPALGEILREGGISFDGELLIKRVISREGRNKVFINGSLSTLQTLARLAPGLISISGQYEHQLLLRPDNHLYLLDDFSGLEDARAGVGKLYDRYQALREEIGTIEAEITAQKEREELTLFQIREIEMADPAPGEDARLAEEKQRLQHAADLLEIASNGYQTLYEKDDSVLTSVAICRKTLEKGAEIASELGVIKDSLADIQTQIEDVSFALRHFQESIEIDPQRLEHIVERLDLLNRLKRKYGGTIQEVLAFKDELASRMFDLEGKIEGLGALKKRLQEVASQLMKRAKTLSQERRKGADHFRAVVEKELRQLHMKDIRFEVRFEDLLSAEGAPAKPLITDVRPDGLDRVEFMISPNPGEALRPLSKIASGGELSRIMLAIRTILSRTASVETVVFDEVDSGVSGATAEVVGEKIASLAAYHQIVCITHLPQIASQGETHFLVKKAISDGRTEASISELSPDARVREIARLLGGREITSRAVAHAQELLKRS